MKIVALIQARMNSTRLPKKVMLDIKSNPMINYLISRLKLSKKINKIVLATTERNTDDILAEFVSSIGIDIYRGSENNVLDRFYKAAKKFEADIVIRITADCPLIDPYLIDKVIEDFNVKNEDYISNALNPSFPDGLDCEVFSFQALEKAWKDAKKPHELEHVTPYIYESGKFKIRNYKSRQDFSHHRWTVDEELDFLVIKNIFEYFHPRIDFDFKEILNLFERKPDLFKHNKHIVRNAGSTMSTGKKLWERAKKSIAGGNMLLSKRPDLFHPKNWPTYFSRAKGCEIWDLDENKFIDMSIMGIGTNILGYSNEEINDFVISNISNGNMSTLNCPEEVHLAEKLLEIHPWANQVRFARSGGEANAIAIRIARAASGKDKVAFCGYHGWHDWYLSTNLNNNKNLDSHHIEGLNPSGVPSSLKNTAFPFFYNDIESLKKLIKSHDIGVIKMEVSRNEQPKDNFLKEVRELATANNIILIFDECTSGFRQTFGGLHKFYEVFPDMAMFGKALGNGFAITAVIGKKEFMDFAQSTFISSTFWTERSGPSAGLKTLEIMEREKSWEKITETGKNIKNMWKEISKKNEIKIEQFGLDALAGFKFSSKNHTAYKTYLTQEMLKKGFLASNLIYVSTEHSQEIIEEYLFHLDNIFKILKSCEEGQNIYDLLDGPVSTDGFKRVN
jgi:glutamate-1-semialdehyde 2,1-aminomutase